MYVLKELVQSHQWGKQLLSQKESNVHIYLDL